MLRVERTIAHLTARQLLGLRGLLTVLFFAALPALVALLFRLQEPAQTTELMLRLFTDFLIPVVLPVVALIFGTGAFGTEIDEGTIIFLATKPVARARIVAAKLTAAAALTALAAVGSTLLAGIVGFGGVGADRIVPAFAVAIAVGSLLYCALFLALGLVLRRAVIVGLIYVIVWEGVAASTFAGTRSLSINQYVLSIADRLTTVDPGMFQAQLAISDALLLGLAMLSIASFLAERRLSAFELTQEG